MILYIETNSIIGGAKGQDIRFEELFRIPAEKLRIALPDVCILEAWSVFEFETRRRNEFSNQLDFHLNEARRDLSSPHALTLATHLEQAKIANLELITDIEQRLRDILKQIVGLPGSNRAELIPTTSHILRQSLHVPSLLKDPTDNLILSTIFSHARRHRTEPKALLTSNTNDFDTVAVRTALNHAGIKFFSRTEAFLGWFHSLSR